MKKPGGILAILAGGKPPMKMKAKKREEDLYDDAEDDLEEDDLYDDMAADDEADLDEEGEDIDDEKKEVLDRMFDAFESRDHAGLWSALGDAVDLMDGGI